MSKGIPLDPDDVVPIETPGDVSNHSSFGHDAGSAFLDVARRRQELSGKQHALILLDGWAVEERYGPIADSRVLLAEDVTDYSEKAYKLEGAYAVDVDSVMDDPDQPFTKVITEVSEEDFDPGTKFLPKKVVECIGSVEQ